MMSMLQRIRRISVTQWSMATVVAGALASTGCAYDDGNRHEGYRHDHDDYNARPAGYYEGDRHERHWDPSHEWTTENYQRRDRDGYRLDREGNRIDRN